MQKSFLFIYAFIYFKGTIYGLENGLFDIHDADVPELPKDDIRKDLSYKSLQKKLKSFIDLNKDLTNLTLPQINSLIWWTEKALTSLKRYQSKVYDETVMTTNCTMPLAPKNGGLVCAYFEKVYYCKPMCNQGYDFSFLRRSRLYETCGHQTGFSWTSQYPGGNRLADCIASDLAISGQSSAYFRNSAKECQEALAMGMEETYMEEFKKELGKNGISSNHRKDLDMLVCGE